MVNHNESALDHVFHALSDPTRRAIVRRLSGGESTVSALAEPFPISLAAVSKHLKALERAGLVKRMVRGRQHFCRLDPRALEDAWDWLRFYERFWNERLDALETLLKEDEENARNDDR